MENNSLKNTNDTNISTSKSNVLKTFTHKIVLQWRLLAIYQKILIGLIIVASVLLPFGYVKIVKPIIDKNIITSRITNSRKNKNIPITTINHSWDIVKLDNKMAKKLPNVNIRQLVLHNKDNQSQCLTFKSVNSSVKHTIKTVIAFGDSKSRDMFNMQADSLEYAMKDKNSSVEVCTLLTNDEYSALAIEALGEVDYNNPANSWRAVRNLLKVDSTGLKNSDSRVSAVLNAVQTIPNVDQKVTISAKSVKNGSFIQWGRLMSDSSNVKKIPALFVDGKNLSGQHLNNPNMLLKNINNLKD